jgi:hypothetical protein
LSAAGQIGSLGEVVGSTDWLVLHRPVELAAEIGKVDLACALFKGGMIGRELSSEFFAKGGILNEFLKFADVHFLCFLHFFPIYGLGSFPLCFQE